MAFLEAVSRETIEEDAKRAATTIQHSSARVILIFCWYTDVGEVFLELAKRNVRGFYDYKILTYMCWTLDCCCGSLRMVNSFSFLFS